MITLATLIDHIIGLLVSPEKLENFEHLDWLAGGGTFFSQFTFTLLASVVLASKWRDYLIDPHKCDVESLKDKIKAELIKVGLSKCLVDPMRVNIEKEYNDCLKKIKDYETSLDDSTKAITHNCKKTCTWCWGVAALIIFSGLDVYLGVATLLLLLPLPIYRRKLKTKNQEKDNEYKAIENDYKRIQKLVNPLYQEQMEQANDAFETYKGTPPGTST